MKKNMIFILTLITCSIQAAPNGKIDDNTIWIIDRSTTYTLNIPGANKVSWLPSYKLRTMELPVGQSMTIKARSLNIRKPGQQVAEITYTRQRAEDRIFEIQVETIFRANIVTLDTLIKVNPTTRAALELDVANKSILSKLPTKEELGEQ
jgi:hypothetical protein